MSTHVLGFLFLLSCICNKPCCQNLLLMDLAVGERVLAPWVPGEDDPQCPELENTFDSPWIRNWDQFETNQKLFGIKSTFNEELYTTKLERGTHMREFEREAMRIAIEIEGEETQDLHLVEERGFDLHDNFDIDEEMRFSSVLRGRGFDDSGYEEEEDIMLDSHNIETFGDSSDSHSRRSADLTSLQGSVGVRIPSSSSLVDNIPPFLATINLNRSDFNDQARWLASELPSKSFPISDSESRIQDDLLGEHRGSSDAKEFAEKQSPSEDLQLSNSVDSHSLLDDKIDASDKAGPCEKRSSSREPSEGPASSKVIGETHSANSHRQPGSCASSNSDCVAAVSANSNSTLMQRVLYHLKRLLGLQPQCLMVLSTINHKCLLYHICTCLLVLGTLLSWPPACYIQSTGGTNTIIITILSSKWTSVWAADTSWSTASGILPTRNAIQRRTAPLTS